MRLAAQKQTLFSILQIRTIPKNTFRLRTSLNFSPLHTFIYLTTISEGPYTLSEETTQGKHKHVTTLLAKNNNISPAAKVPFFFSLTFMFCFFFVTKSLKYFLENNFFLKILYSWPSSVHQWPGRPGFNPRSSHTKDSKNGTWCHLA